MTRWFLLGALVVGVSAAAHDRSMQAERSAPLAPDPPPTSVAFPSPIWSDKSVMHQWNTAVFVSQRGFGFGRMAPMDLQYLVPIDGRMYRVDRRRLVGDSMHAEARLYEEIQGSHKRIPERSRWTPLDDVDAAAMRSIRRSEDLVVTPDRRRMLGAIRARKSCLECHEVEPGTPLGAIRYDLTPAPPGWRKWVEEWESGLMTLTRAR